MADGPFAVWSFSSGRLILTALPRIGNWKIPFSLLQICKSAVLVVVVVLVVVRGEQLLCLLIADGLTAMTAVDSTLMWSRLDEGTVVRACPDYPARRRTKSVSYRVGRVAAHAAATPNSCRRRIVRSRDQPTNRWRCCRTTETGSWTTRPCFWWFCTDQTTEYKHHYRSTYGKQALNFVSTRTTNHES